MCYHRVSFRQDENIKKKIILSQACILMPRRLVVIYGICKIDGYTYYEYTFHLSDLDVLMGYYVPPSSYLGV